MTKRQHREPKSGFTLIELLVVIAIIAVLAGLLLPALFQAKQSARSARCISNLRQIGFAFHLYVEDHQSFPLIGSVFSTVKPEGSKWYDDLNPYTRQTWTNNLYSCPGYRGAVRDGRIAEHVIYGSFGSYGYNVGTADLTDVFQFGLAGKFVGPGEVTQIPMGEDVMKVPSDMIAIGDSFSTLSQRKRLLLVGLELLSRRLYSQLDTGGSTDSAGAKEAKIRHRKKMNVAFGDAHVEALDYRKALLDQDPEALKRWHSDNEPHLEFLQ